LVAPITLHGAHQHALLGGVHPAQRRDVARADHIVPNRRAHIPFHHRHVFVRGRVEYTIGSVFAEHALERRPVRDVAEQWNQLQIRMPFTKLELRVEQLRLALIEQHQLFRTVPRDLARELRTD
jgi:hypothetical protein